MGYPLFSQRWETNPSKYKLFPVPHHVVKCVVFSVSVCYNVEKDNPNEVAYEKEIVIFGFRRHIAQ